MCGRIENLDIYITLKKEGGRGGQTILNGAKVPKKPVPIIIFFLPGMPDLTFPSHPISILPS